MLKKSYLLLPIIFLLVFLGVGDMSLSQDLGRHIKTGEIIVKCFCVPKVNLYSYTQPDFPFINHHWMPEVFFYFLNKFFGLSGIFAFKVIGITFAFSLSYYLALKKGKFWAFSLAFFFAYVLSERIDSRPEVFSFIFISLFLFLIEKYRQTKNIKYLSLLPLIEIFWVNSHIYFIVGIIIFVSLIVSEFIKDKKLNKNLILIFTLLFIATFINPNGIKGALLPFTIFNNYNYSIVENQNLFFLNSFFGSARILTFEILSLAFIVLLFLNFRKNDIFYSLTSFFAVVSAYEMIRNFPIFVFIVLPYMTYLSVLSEAKIKDIYLTKNLKAILLLVLIVFALYRSYKIVTYPIYGMGVIDAIGPSVDYFEKNNLQGQIFNNFDTGSYLIYRLYSKTKVFIDGRPEAYSKASFEEYKRMQTDTAFFNKEVEKYNINTVIFSRNDLTPWGQQFLASIVRNPSWNQVFQDEWMIIYTRKTK